MPKSLRKISGHNYHEQYLFVISGFTLHNGIMINTQKECNFCETGYNRKSLYQKICQHSYYSHILFIWSGRFLRSRQAFVKDELVKSCMS
jgi:hypothetical protein